ncbi:GNAT family N-acetyltransferase [Paludibacterium paludis]|uniref:N-acetyltransferase n=1 Tax=Paludibacterium paludis TaxID=1225769 RepID=A0A918UBT5_9NEIS|nr:GNAT family N-acetyltransferase [Paludibacterium paludis]GGY24731.1 N-acetyltransferase [Paludibacterium paludis]
MTTPLPRQPDLHVLPYADEEARRVINEGLGRYNIAHAGIDDDQPLDVTVTDPQTGRPAGGLTGRTSLGVFFINVFYLPESLRQQGLGSRILGLAEDEARRRGCRTAMLFTMEIQAPDFYRKHGYVEFGRVDCRPDGNARVFLQKTLHQPDRHTQST